MRCRRLVALLVAGGLMWGFAAASSAADEKKPAEIKLELKDFKFKPPPTVSDPDSLFTYSPEEEKLNFYTSGPAEVAFKIPAEGEYEIVITASCEKAVVDGKDEWPKFKLSIDDQAVGDETALSAEFAKDYKLPAKIKSGDHKLTIEFTNDKYDPDGKYDSNFYLHGAKLVKK